MTGLEKALEEVARIMDRDGIPYMVIGGAALLFHGSTRVTKDIDVTVWVDESSFAGTLDRLMKSLPGGAGASIESVAKTRVLTVRATSGVPIDLIFGALPFEKDAIMRAAKMKLGGVTVRVCRPEDLVIHKVISDRPRDIEDMRFLITRHGKKMDKKALDRTVEELVKELARDDILRRYTECWEE